MPLGRIRKQYIRVPVSVVTTRFSLLPRMPADGRNILLICLAARWTQCMLTTWLWTSKENLYSCMAIAIVF